jgi:tetratricopeptide (TPR) repeat protein
MPWGRGLGWVTLAIFALLFGVAFFVFFYLPQWVSKPGSAPPIEESSPPVAEEMPDATPPPPLEDRANLKTEAERARDQAVGLQQALDEKDVDGWGGEEYGSARSAIETGDRHLNAKSFAEATQLFQEAVSRLESLNARSKQVLREALARGQRALDAGDAAAAKEAFGLARTLEPGNRTAAAGLRRAEVLNDVISLVVAGENHERRGDLESAAERYRQAVSLDPLSKAAQQALSRVDERSTEEAFTEALSEAMAALNFRDWIAARDGFHRANAIKPGARQVADGLARVEEGLRLDTIAQHRDRAAAFEKNEDWHAAAKEYQAVLDLDPTIQFAQDGKGNAVERAKLSDELSFHLSHPERLSDDKVLREASALLSTAAGFEDAGPKMRQQIARLDEIVSKASIPVKVVLISDGYTEVVIYKVGRFGTLDRRDIELRPGSYTVVGTRNGYRDVRLTLAVVAGEITKPLVVVCREKI